MGQKTEIQWCDSTVNPTSGCDGCELWNKPAGVRSCYAGNIHERFSPSTAYPGAFEQIDLHPGRIEQAARWKPLAGVARPGKPWIPPAMPRIVFVGDMADMLSRAVPLDYILGEFFDVAESPAGSRHVWMMLTKQAGRLAELDRHLAALGRSWPGNIWAGVSVTNGRTAKRLDSLCRTSARVKFASYEPAREFVDFRPWLGLYDDSGDLRPGLDLVICGGESRQNKGGDPAIFDLGWARQTIHHCREAGAAFFLKQLGSRPGEWVPSGETRMRFRDSHGGDWSEWPADLRVREFPRSPVPAA